jgi:hypothetical protein
VTPPAPFPQRNGPPLEFAAGLFAPFVTFFRSGHGKNRCPPSASRRWKGSGPLDLVWKKLWKMWEIHPFPS